MPLFGTSQHILIKKLLLFVRGNMFTLCICYLLFQVLVFTVLTIRWPWSGQKRHIMRGQSCIFSFKIWPEITNLLYEGWNFSGTQPPRITTRDAFSYQTERFQSRGNAWKSHFDGVRFENQFYWLFDTWVKDHSESNRK